MATWKKSFDKIVRTLLRKKNRFKWTIYTYDVSEELERKLAADLAKQIDLEIIKAIIKFKDENRTIS